MHSDAANLCGLQEVIGTLYDQIGFVEMFQGLHNMARRLFEQVVLLHLATPAL